MPFLSRTQVPEALRLPHLTEYKEQIRQRLLFAASEAERQHLLRLLDKADDSKPAYTADSPAPIGAIDPAKVEQTFL